MLIKLIKYEIKSVFRTLLPLYGAILALSLILRPVAGVNYYDLALGENTETVAGILLLVFFALIIAMLAITAVSIIQRFRKTMFGNEGYLMHTLPVKPWQHIVAKLAVALLISTLGIVVIILASLIITFTGDPEVWQMLGMVWHEMINSLSFFFDFSSFNWLIAAEIILSGIVSAVQSIMVLYLAISIGHLWSGKQDIGAVFAFIGISIAKSYIMSFALRFVSVPQMMYGSERFAITSTVHSMIFLNLAANVLLTAVFFAGVNYILTNKLNLE